MFDELKEQFTKSIKISSVALTIMVTLMNVLALSSFSQISKNTIMVGGSGRLNLDQPNFVSIDIAPSAGWFVAKNFVVGASPAFYFNYGGRPQANSRHSFSPSIYSRYYINLNSKIALYPSVGLGSVFSKGYNNSLPRYYGSMALGTAIWLNKIIALEPSLGIRVFSITHPISNGSRGRVTKFFEDKIPNARVALQIYLNRH